MFILMQTDIQEIKKIRFYLEYGWPGVWTNKFNDGKIIETNFLIDCSQTWPFIDYYIVVIYILLHSHYILGAYADHLTFLESLLR